MSIHRSTKDQGTTRSFAPHHAIDSVIEVKQIFMIFEALFTIMTRISSITRWFYATTTWGNFWPHVFPTLFILSPNIVKGSIMADINDLVQEFRKSSREGDVASEMFPFFSKCFICLKFLEGNFWNVCFDRCFFLRFFDFRCLYS